MSPFILRTVHLDAKRWPDKQLMRTLITPRSQHWQQLTLAGRVLRSDSNVDLKSSFAWLREGKLSSTQFRNVIAAQEGCLLTRPTLPQELTSTRVVEHVGTRDN